MTLGIPAAGKGRGPSGAPGGGPGQAGDRAALDPGANDGAALRHAPPARPGIHGGRSGCRRHRHSGRGDNRNSRDCIPPGRRRPPSGRGSERQRSRRVRSRTSSPSPAGLLGTRGERRSESGGAGCGIYGASCRNFPRAAKPRYCPIPGKVPMPLHRIVSITSSAPPAMEARRPSRKARLTGVSFMYPMPPQYCRQALGNSRPN
jgi:hypothetical protein